MVSQDLAKIETRLRLAEDAAQMRGEQRPDLIEQRRRHLRRRVRRQLIKPVPKGASHNRIGRDDGAGRRAAKARISEKQRQ